MTQKEQIGIIVKKIQIVDEQLKYLKTLFSRLEDRVISLEEQVESSYREHREVVFESDFDVDNPWNDDEDKDDDEDE